MRCSIYLKAVALLAALTCHNVDSLNLREQSSTQLVRKSSIEKSDVAEYKNMLSVDPDKKLTFYWNVDKEFLDARVVYKGQSWLGFGISTNGDLNDAEAIIGKPEKPKRNQVRKYSFVGDAWTKTEKMYEKFQTLVDRSLDQDASTTTLSFKKRLNEDGEIVIKGQDQNHIILVVGEKNEFQDPALSYVLKMKFDHADQSGDNKEETTSKEAASTKDINTKSKEAEAEATGSKKDDFVTKQGNYMYVIVAAFIGGLSLLTLMVGTVAMMREAEREQTSETMYEPFMHDIR